MQEHLQAEVAAHQRTVVALNQHLNTEGQAEWKILEMREEAKQQQQQWFEDQLANRGELVKKAEQTLRNEIDRLEDYHAREVTL